MTNSAYNRCHENLALQPGVGPMSSFALYLIGTVVLIGGVAWALIVAGIPTLYVVIASIILLGLGILSAVSRTRTKDQPKGP